MIDEIIVDAMAAEQAEKALPDLINLLQGAVASGASIGFLELPSNIVAEEYWRYVVADVAGGICVLLVAREPFLSRVRCD